MKGNERGVGGRDLLIAMVVRC